MYTPMTRDECYQFIRDHAITAHLATVRADGRPHVAPIWIMTDGLDIVFSTGDSTVKGKNLLRSGYAALSMDDSVPPFNSVRIEGPVTFETKMDVVKHWSGKIGARYMGADQEAIYAERNGVPGEMICRLSPSRISGLKDVAAFPTEEEA